ncbi:MAG: FUN14 domain-containing protein [Candidatus Riflebacteria bacterium]|nr:FUN14 domain-containing protein [Candidatus Riflebacteria bacterium]
MTNKSYKKYFYVFAATAGMLAVSQILDAETASNTVEIMAKTASNASDTALASGSAVLDQLLGGQGTYWLATLGGGGIAGWCVGYTLKKVAKVVAIFLGITFITLQYLAYKHVITVDWTKVQNAVDKQHLEQSAQGLMSFLTYNLPFAGSFLVGFWLGFRKG